MNYDKLHEEFKSWQEDQPSPYEIQYKKFLSERIAKETVRETFIDLTFSLLELKREFKDSLEANNPGLYD